MKKRWEGAMRWKTTKVAGNSGRGKSQILRIIVLILMEMDCSLDPDPKLARACSALTDRARGVPNTGGTATCRLPWSPSFEPADVPGRDDSSRQCNPFGDSLNDEQRSDDLFNPPSIRKPVRRPWLCERLT